MERVKTKRLLKSVLQEYEVSRDMLDVTLMYLQRAKYLVNETINSYRET
jgi:hypothetical protein